MGNVIKSLDDFSKYQRAHSLVDGGTSNGPKLLYKYMDICAALKSLASGTLRFSQPSAWTDKWEEHFYTANYSTVNKGQGYNQPAIWACCFTTNKVSEAAWLTYKYGKQRSGNIVVKLTLSRTELRKQILNNLGMKVEVYEGFMNYSLSDFEIQNLHVNPALNPALNPNNYPHYNKVFAGVFGLQQYLSLMLLKRRAFYYEGEFRFMIIDKNVNVGKSGLSTTMDIKIDWSSVIKGAEVEVDEDCKPGSSEWMALGNIISSIKNVAVQNVSIKPVNLYEDPGTTKGPITIK